MDRQDGARLPTMRTSVVFLAFLVMTACATTAIAAPKVDRLLRKRAELITGSSQVIIRTRDPASVAPVGAMVRKAGGRPGRTLHIINAVVATVPNAALATLAQSRFVAQLSLDRSILAANERTGVTVGATAVRQQFGYDGTGVGVAVIDSGVASWHDDLSSVGGGQRVDRFVDFANGRARAYDDYGHGTHVAGIIAGNGFDSSGRRSGVAPGAHLIVLKVLDAAGYGRISDVIAALDYVVANKAALNIRVVNLSVAAGVYESYNSDPLTLAAERAVAAGIVVVAAAGNQGRDEYGRTQYGGITAPGNAPSVLTVGGSNHRGTTNRADDTMAVFSSRGPAAVDYGAKPDIVAPAVGIESLSAPGSAFYANLTAWLLPGTVPTTYLPYLSLSGTSMAAPVVSGAVALMLQANPTLTPNEIKAILQYTAEVYPDHDPLTEGAGFLNVKGAVELSQFLGVRSNGLYPSTSNWSARLIWGNQLLSGGRLTASANAWLEDVTWGTAVTPNGQNVEWGVLCSTPTCDETTDNVWRATCSNAACSDVTWGGGSSGNVVWGSACGGADCQQQWSPGIGAGVGSVVWGTVDEGDTVVWGTADEGDTVVWGTNDTATAVWGVACSDPACEPIVWGPE